MEDRDRLPHRAEPYRWAPAPRRRTGGRWPHHLPPQGRRTPRAVIAGGRGARYRSERSPTPSNFNGDGSARDADGFVSRVGPEGEIEALRFMTGTDAAPLHAPRGMFITGDTLWVADVDGVHAFHRGSGPDRGRLQRRRRLRRRGDRGRPGAAGEPGGLEPPRALGGREPDRDQGPRQAGGHRRGYTPPQGRGSVHRPRPGGRVAAPVRRPGQLTGRIADPGGRSFRPRPAGGDQELPDSVCGGRGLAAVGASNSLSDNTMQE